MAGLGPAIHEFANNRLRFTKKLVDPQAKPGDDGMAISPQLPDLLARRIVEAAEIGDEVGDGPARLRMAPIRGEVLERQQDEGTGVHPGMR